MIDVASSCESATLTYISIFHSFPPAFNTCPTMSAGIPAAIAVSKHDADICDMALVISRFACLGALTVMCVSQNSSVTELVMRLRGSSCALYSRNGSASLPPSAALTLSAALSAALTCPLLSS